MVQFAQGWESAALHCPSPFPAAGTNTSFGTAENNNQYLPVTSDREASNKAKIMFQVIAQQLENDAIPFLQKACLLQVSLC